MRYLKTLLNFLLSMIKTPVTKHRNGFTLLEAIIYSALFSILITGVLLTSYPLLEGSARSREKAYIEIETVFIIAKVRSALARSITTKNIISDLIPREGDGATSTLRSEIGGFAFENHGTNLLYSEDAAPFSPLHSSRSEITDFLVLHEVLDGSHFLTVSWKTNGEVVGPFRIYFHF